MKKEGADMYADLEGDSAAIGTVLIVEDEFLVSTMIEDCLLDLGAPEGLVSGSVEEARRMAEQRRFGCAILDVRVGGADSFVVADMLHERGVPFMFASAFLPEDVPERHRHRPFLAKPFLIEDLASRVREIVAGRQDKGSLLSPEIVIRASGSGCP